jgi:glucose-1-phosphate adenylyltransferase
MDLRAFYDFHVRKKAEVSVACNLVDPEDISAYGIMGIDEASRVREFMEKPSREDLVRHLRVMRGGRPKYLCSMGIYFFNKETLHALLSCSQKADFGKEIIPEAIADKDVYAYEFDGYWRDIGTIKSFYTENLLLTREDAPLDLFDEEWQLYTRSRSLPPAKYAAAQIENSIVADGSIVGEATIRNSIIGLRSLIGKNAVIEDSIIMGADYYETAEEIRQQKRGTIAIGIGEGSVVRHAILDKNARVGRRVRITNEAGLQEHATPQYMIRDGIVIVYKNATIPDGTVI